MIWIKIRYFIHVADPLSGTRLGCCCKCFFSFTLFEVSTLKI